VKKLEKNNELKKLKSLIKMLAQSPTMGRSFLHPICHTQQHQRAHRIRPWAGAKSMQINKTFRELR
jgi:murein endopeptidase